MSPAGGSLAAPSRLLAALEQRAVVEFAGSVVVSPLLRLARGGDGGPVLVLPGFAASDVSTAPLRWALRSKGYDAHGWSLGRNLGPTPGIVDGLAARLDEMADRHGRRVRIVGWSLGGIYARHLARMAPDRVHQVVTLGSPFRMRAGDRSTVTRLVEELSPGYARDYREHLDTSETERGTLPVHSTAVYTKTDGIVRWEACIEHRTPSSESIEVLGSHTGLGHNATAVFALLDRLAQPLHAWRPFRPPRLLRHLYPEPEHAELVVEPAA